MLIKPIRPNEESTMMRRVQGPFFLLVAAGALAVLFSVTPALASDMDENAKALAKVDDDWSKAAATQDADRVASFYAEDGIAYPPNDLMAIGRTAAKKVWAAHFADKTFAISWRTLHADVSGDLGYTAGIYEASFKQPDGKPVDEKGKYVTAWKKQKDGTWKAIHDIWNADAK
jgi:uncharacterized protein (TIGR02246 family)